MSAPTPARPRGRTRWILLGTVLALAAVIAGAAWLESAHPQLDPGGREVTGIPPLASDQVRTCRRPDEADVVTEIHRHLPLGGRISSEQVYACPAAYDGREVTFVGEIVGDVLRRRSGAWAQVNDDAYALRTGPLVGHRERSGFNTGLSVWLDGDLADRVESPGRPALRGDVVLLTGTLLRADPDDGGGITLRATSLQTLAPPLAIDPPLHRGQLIVAIILGLLALLATLDTLRHHSRT